GGVAGGDAGVGGGRRGRTGRTGRAPHPPPSGARPGRRTRRAARALDGGAASGGGRGALTGGLPAPASSTISTVGRRADSSGRGRTGMRAIPWRAATLVLLATLCAPRAGACLPAIYLDGAQVQQSGDFDPMAGFRFDLRSIRAREIVGVEVFRSAAEVPAQFSGNS